MTWQEDDVVNAVADLWRPVCTVVAVGGNQSALHFHTRERRRKSPDLVAYTSTTIVICEAKVRPAGLFAGGEDSDAAHLRAMLGDQRRCCEFRARVGGLLHAMEIPFAEDASAVGVLIAGSAFSPQQTELAHGMACVEVDRDGAACAVAGSQLLPGRCLAALGRPRDRDHDA
jgi:hypothetical protein